ncbi:hypothetical protein O181_085036 [Austropuccinia psidii MF-1]|uniref:Uncharacterized protein n=1 Tax=Austropuccinia psidii MF-1 TaxID=1389203 RepID=A0A9Q3IJD0_9BASI|nr:hypothetical protein [Austropuccinia psidii MF-1]
MPPTQLTILTLAECPPNTAYHPYACVVPSRHAPNTTYPYAWLVPSQHASDTACHPYALRLCSALPTLLTILTLAECPPDMLLTPLILTLPYYIHSVRWLVGVHNERNCRNMLSGLLCQQDLRGNWSVYSQCCG